MNVVLNTPHAMSATIVDVKGSLRWSAGNVYVGPLNPKSMVHVFAGGTMTLAATGVWGGASLNGATKYFNLLNDGTVQTVSEPATGVATINGDYTTSGTTLIGEGWTLDLLGNGEQSGGSFQLQRGTVKMSYPGRPLGIRGGDLVGSGIVTGNLALGGSGVTPTGGDPILSPISVGDMSFGRIVVTADFRVYNGKVQVGVGGPGATWTDRVEVGGSASLGGGVAIGTLRADYRRQGPADRAVFLTAAPVAADFSAKFPPPAWKYDHNAAECWFQPIGVVDGKVNRDDNQNGLLDAGEPPLPGAPVVLLDQDGNWIDDTTTAADGTYRFEGLSAGTYQVQFKRPADLRTDPPHLGGPESPADSDYDVGTLIAAVTLDDTRTASDPDTDALFRPLTAADDYYTTPYHTPVGGNVLANDPPKFDDVLTVTLETAPAHGHLALNDDGTFIYGPDDRFWGTDAFVYRVTD